MEGLTEKDQIYYRMRTRNKYRTRNNSVSQLSNKYKKCGLGVNSQFLLIGLDPFSVRLLILHLPAFVLCVS